MGKKRIVMVCFLVVVMNIGCKSLLSGDDGTDYASDESIIASATVGRPSFPGAHIDYGDAPKFLIVHVTDRSGNPIQTATMDVRLYFSDKIYGAWTDLPASELGEISFFAPGHFGPLRIDIFVVKAEGFIPRLIKDPRARSSDTDQPIFKDEWDIRIAEFKKGLVDPLNGKGSGVDFEYPFDRSMKRCYRKIVLKS